MTGATHVQLLVDIGAVFQQRLRYAGVSVLGGSGESSASILPSYKMSHTIKKKKDGEGQCNCCFHQLLIELHLSVEFRGGAKFKQELDDVIMALLGSEEESSRTCLRGTIKTTTIKKTCKRRATTGKVTFMLNSWVHVTPVHTSSVNLHNHVG